MNSSEKCLICDTFYQRRYENLSMLWDYGLLNACSNPFSKGDQPLYRRNQSFHEPVIEVYGNDPLTKNEDPIEEASDEEKKELQKSQANVADSSYSSLIKYNFVFYFIYKHKYENRKPQMGLRDSV